MAIGYKNLILINNSRSMGEANFQLCKETAKYICSNLENEDLCRLAVIGENIGYLTDYTGEAEMLTQCIDGIEMCDTDTYITDNLVGILSEWEEQDVACRNIILFTDGEEAESVLHANEELYYMLSEAGYPVYIVQSVDNRNEPASKNLSAIARISGGRLILTEFEGSEGGSEIIMGDELIAAINEKRASDERTDKEVGADMSGDFEASEDMYESSFASEGYEGAAADDALYGSDYADAATADAGALFPEQSYLTKAVYASDDNTPIIRKERMPENVIGLSVIIPAAGLLFAVIFAVTIWLITRRNRKAERRDQKIMAGISEEIERESRIAEAAEDYDLSTCKLDDELYATRLLDQTEGEYDITLEDCNDPTRLFRASCDDSLIVGRSGGLCDIVIDRDDSISGRHCELSVRSGCWYVRDLQSSNGTRVNNQKVFQELMLKTGDILQLGQSALQVSI